MEQFANRPPMSRQDEEQENSVIQPRCAVRAMPAPDTALTIHDAAFDGDVPKVRAFLELGVSINAQNQNGNTALHIAAREGHVEMARFLRSQPGVDENLENVAQQKAVDCAKNDEMRAVFSAPDFHDGIRQEEKIPTIHKYNLCNGNMYSAKVVASLLGLLAVAYLSGAFLVAVGVANPALAAMGGGWLLGEGMTFMVITGLLLSGIHQVEEREGFIKYGKKFNKLVKRRKSKLVRKALVSGVNPNGYGVGYPVFIAVANKDTQIINDLLRYGANPNVKDEEGYTPVFRAIMAGDAEVVKVLRSSPHTDLDVPNNEGQTARAYLHLLPKENPSVLQGEENAPQAEKKRSSPRKRLKRDNTVKQGPSCTPKPPGTLS
ncbi:MAG TPA: hypothetical protein DCW68_02170 [Rhodospirillaceae bacterium]|nr:MAG: hypothetical protein A2018_05135 [Alphaproteobacteria bacterium GWF2_58_20]HAU28901.1 hypothetical protein [Rhodospirillaceae bacterium]